MKNDLSRPDNQYSEADREDLRKRVEEAEKLAIKKRDVGNAEEFE